MDFISGLPSCVNGCNAFFTCVDCLTKYTVLTACILGAGSSAPNRLHYCFLGALSDSLACLTMWSMIGTHISLQSSGLNFGTPLDLVLSFLVLTIPKLMVRRRGKTEHWSRPLDVYWLSNTCLKQSGVAYYVMLSLLLTQLLLRV